MFKIKILHFVACYSLFPDRRVPILLGLAIKKLSQFGNKCCIETPFLQLFDITSLHKNVCGNKAQQYTISSKIIGTLVRSNRVRIRPVKSVLFTNWI